MSQWSAAIYPLLYALLAVLVLFSFGLIRKHREREELARLFGKYVPRDLIEDLGKPGKPAELAWDQRDVRFVLLAVSGASADTINQHLVMACEYATKQRWTIQTLVCNVVLFIDGALPSTAPVKLEGQQFAEGLVRLLNTDGKALHGADKLSVGASGGEFRRAWGAQWLISPALLDFRLIDRREV